MGHGLNRILTPGDVVIIDGPMGLTAVTAERVTAHSVWYTSGSGSCRGSRSVLGKSTLPVEEARQACREIERNYARALLAAKTAKWDAFAKISKRVSDQ